MDFFNSLSQVAQNGENFKKWEQEQRDNEAQRKALYERRNYSPEEIEAAKQFGERIIDVVDIMDNHSENVAENVETAVSPVVSLLKYTTGYSLLSYGILAAKDFASVSLLHFFSSYPSALMNFAHISENVNI